MLTPHSGPDPNEVQRAKQLCLELLEAVKTSYEAFKERGPRGGGGYGGGGSGGGRYNDDGQGGGGYHHQRGDRNGSGSYGGGGGNGQYGGGGGGYGQQSAGGYGTGAAQSPQAAQAPAVDPAEQQRQVAAWTAYYAANPHEDPYAQYGGYGTMMQYYYSQGQGQPQGQPGYAQSPIQQQGQNGAPPPPPPPDDSSAPPPPPPPGSASGGGVGGYNAVSEDICGTENLRIYLTYGLKMPPPPGM